MPLFGAPDTALNLEDIPDRSGYTCLPGLITRVEDNKKPRVIEIDKVSQKFSKGADEILNENNNEKREENEENEENDGNEENEENEENEGDDNLIRDCATRFKCDSGIRDVKCYREYSRKLHPDKGGDEKEMQKLNICKDAESFDGSSQTAAISKVEKKTKEKILAIEDQSGKVDKDKEDEEDEEDEDIDYYEIGKTLNDPHCNHKDPQVDRLLKTLCKLNNLEEEDKEETTGGGGRKKYKQKMTKKRKKQKKNKKKTKNKQNKKRKSKK